MSHKYLFFIATLCAGGGEKVISILSKELAHESDNVVEILIYFDKEPFYNIDPNIKLTRVQRETGSNNLFKNIFFIRKYFKNFNGVIISFLAPFNILALIAHIGQRTPIIVADRSDPKKVPSNFFIRKLRDVIYFFADGVVLQTKSNQLYFSSRIQKKSTVIYNPISIQRKEGIALQTKKEKEIVMVSRLIPLKNHKLLIDAFDRITSDFPDWHLLFFGDGIEKEKLEKYIFDKGLSDKVFLCGEISNVLERIARSEIFVLSSNYEGMPNALLEAMCLGLPVISTNVSGARDLIENGTNGILVEVGDVVGMANALKLLMSDCNLRRAMGENALKLNEQLDSRKIIAEWKLFIDRIIAL